MRAQRLRRTTGEHLDDKNSLFSSGCQSYTALRMKKHTSLTLLLLVGLGAHHPALVHAGEKITAADLIAKHLSAIGTEEARKRNEQRTLEGPTAVKFVVGGHGVLQGTGRLLSRENDMRYTMHLDAIDYPGEDFLKAGEQTSIAIISPGTRSALGKFLFFNSEILREGLVGGVMSAAWPLLNLEAHHAKLTVRGVKKMGDKQLYEVLYLPRKANSDLDILLYFDAQTFQHVMTRYHLKVHAFPGLRGSNGGSSDAANDVEERFSEFHQVNGITIPLRWIIHYEGDQGMILDYEMVAQKAGQAVAADAFKMP